MSSVKVPIGLLLAWGLTLPWLSAAPGLRWRTDLETPVRFQRILSDDLLLVGTERHLFAVYSRDGAIAWRLRNVSVDPDQVRTVPGAGMLLVSEGWGGRFQDRQSSLISVDAQTGRILWESPTIKQQILSVTADSVQRRLLLVTAQEPHGKGALRRKLSVFLVDATNGAMLWRRELDRKIRLSPRPRPEPRDTNKRGFDLAAYRDPILDGSRIYLFYDGIRCLNAANGSAVWFAKWDLNEEGLALSYAEPYLEDDILYVAARGRVRAFNAITGRQLWKSGDYETITELYFDADRIYAKLGGIFLDLDWENWQKQGPYGVVVLDRARGKKLWKWDDASDGITNLLIFGDRIYLADRKRLVALDRYTGKRLYRRGHKFEKAPHWLGLTEENRLVLAGPEDVSAFEYGDGQPLWRHHLPPPGVGIWKKLAAGLLGSSGVVLGAASLGLAIEQNLLPAVPAPFNRVFGYRGRLRRLTGRAGLELIRAGGGLWSDPGFARLEGHYHYFFTRLPEGGKGLVGVNLNTGRLQHQLRLRETDDRLAISEGGAMVFDPEGSKVSAYAIDRGPAPNLGNAAPSTSPPNPR